MKKLCIGFACIAFLSGCEAVNSGIGAVNDALTTINGSTNSSSSTNGAAFVPDSVKQATMLAFTKSQEQQVQKMIDEAMPTIVDMVSRAACGTKDNVMGRYTDPDSYTSSYVNPEIGMSYHKSGCLTPIRIQGWEKRAANALRFSVVYMSPQSEETTRRGYTAVKQEDGSWLFKW